MVARKLVVAILGLIFLVPETLGAQSKCLSAKLKAMGKLEAKALDCFANADTFFGDPLLTAGACWEKADENFDSGLAKADTAGPCSGAAESCGCLVTRCWVDVLTEVPFNVDTSAEHKCWRARVKAAGKKAKRILLCNAKAAKANVPVDAICIQKAKDKFAAAFAKTAGCSGSETEATVEARVDNECVADVGADSAGGALVGTLCETPPAPLCETETTPCGSCGGGVCNVARSFEHLGNCALVCLDTATANTFGCTTDSDCPSGQLCGANGLGIYCAAPCP